MLLCNFSALKDVSRVGNLNDGTELLNVENLMIRERHKICDLSMLSKLKYLFLRECDRINGEVLSWPTLITVEVLDCKRIHSYTALL
jgi:hypothetical protein